MAVRVFDGVDDVLVLDEGALDTVLSGAWTIAVLFKRSGSTTDGTQFLISLNAGVNSNQRGCVSISSASALQLTVGGVTRTFGFTLTDDVWYLVVVKKAAGTATPRANLWSYSTDTWAGWANGSDTLDADATTLVEVRLGNGPGGFPLNGKIGGAVVYSTALSDSDGETLEDTAQHWFDLTPVAMWRLNQASTSTAVTDDTTGDADQTLLTGTTVDTGDDPDPWSFSLGGTTYTQSVSGSSTATAALARQTNKTAAGTATPTGFVVRQTARSLAGAATATSALTRQAAKTLAGTTTASGALQRLISRILAGSTTPAGTALKLLSRLLGGSTTPSGSVSSSVTQLRNLSLVVGAPQTKWNTGTPGQKWQSGDPQT